MPNSMTPDQEKDWERAKKLISDQYPGKLKSDEDGFYALVMSVYKNIRSSKDESIDWVRVLELVKPANPAISEDNLEIKTEATDLQPGDHIVVTTKIGRTMISGVVTSVVNGAVTIRSEHDRLRSFPAELYNFLKVTTQEDAGLEEVHLGRSRPEPAAAEPEYDSSIRIRDLGPTPIINPEPSSKPVEIISKYLVGDVRWASEIWSDLNSIGAVRTMRKHQIGGDSMSNILADLSLHKLWQSQGV
jgi:hypothetical protein